MVNSYPALTLSEYQSASVRTMKKQPADLAIIEMAMGISGEAGEVLDAVKKIAFHGHALDKMHIAEELGDVLFYIAGMCTTLGISLESVAAGNIDKLKLRYPDGFSEQLSRERDRGK